MIECPKDYLYHPRHLWLQVDEASNTAAIGITDEMQERLPEIISLDLPTPGIDLEIDEPCFHFHLPSGIRHLKSPLSGRVVEVNREILDNPELLHLAPYEHWMVKLEMDTLEELQMLLDAKSYTTLIEAL